MWICQFDSLMSRKGILFARCIAVICAYVGMEASAAGADVSWTTAAALESRSDTAASPRLAMDSNGNAMAVWVQSDGTASSIYANRYTAGTGWGTATLLESSSMPADAPQIAADSSGNFIAIWRQAWNVVNGTEYGIYASRYVSGQGWGTPAVVFLDNKREDISANADPQIAMDAAGNAVAVWSVYDWSWNHTSVRANRYVSGTGWSGVVNLSTESVQAASGGNVAMDASGNAMVVWSQDKGTTNSTQGVHAVRFSISSGWGTPARIEDATVAATRTGWGPTVVFDSSGNAIVVWYQYAKPGIYSARYTTASGWGTPQLIPDTGTTSYDEGVTLGVDKNGNAMAIWNQSGGVLYANRYVAGAGWGTTAIIESGGPNYSAKVAFDKNGNALAIWGNYSCNSYNLPFAQFSVNTGWAAVKRCYDSPAYVNSTRDYASEPQLVIDGSGNALAIWLQNGSIWSARYSPPVTTADCIFNWGEKTYPSYFAPAGSASSTALDYYYRYYATTRSYLAIASRDNHLYYFGPLSNNALLDLGLASNWQTTSGCK